MFLCNDMKIDYQSLPYISTSHSARHRLAPGICITMYCPVMGRWQNNDVKTSGGALPACLAQMVLDTAVALGAGWPRWGMLLVVYITKSRNLIARL